MAEPSVSVVPRSPRRLSLVSRNGARAKRRRRSANLPSGPRELSFLVRVSKEEHAEINRLAALAEVTGPRLMREAVLAPEIPVSEAEFRELLHMLFRNQSELQAIVGELRELRRIAEASSAPGGLSEHVEVLAETLAVAQILVQRTGDAVEAVRRW